MLLRYTGVLPVTFVSIGREVVPGDEFEVPDVGAEAFTSRIDVETVAAVAAPRTPRSKGAVSSSTAGPVSDSTASPEEGDNDAVSDRDH